MPRGCNRGGSEYDEGLRAHADANGNCVQRLPGRYTFFQVPSGGLADRVSARRIFIVLCTGWLLLTGLTALVGWRGFGLAVVIPQLWLIRALFGVIAAPTYPRREEPLRSRYRLACKPG